MGLKEVFLQKGWAGRTISREETVEHLNPLIKQHMALNLAYNYVIKHGSEGDVTKHLAPLQRVARMDVGKLMESVLSCGGTAYNGVDLEPDAVDLGQENDEMLFQLRDLEQAFRDALQVELDTVEHQIRSRAILTVVHTNSVQRLNYLKDTTKQRHRKALSV